LSIRKWKLLEPQRLIAEDDRDAVGRPLAIDDENLFTPLCTPYAA